MKDVEQRGVTRKPSVHVGLRLQEADQERVAFLVENGHADNVTDALRYALACAVDRLKGEHR